MSCLDPHPLCAHYQRAERTWFGDFIRGRVKKAWDSLCPSNAISLTKGMRIDSQSCVSCLLCAAFCPHASIAFTRELEAYIVEPHHSGGCSSAFLRGGSRRSVDKPVDLIRGTDKSVIEDVERCDTAKLRSRLHKFTKFMNVDFDGLARWAGSCLYYITSDQGGTTAYSVKIKGAKREIRLEMCHAVDRALALCKFDNQIDFSFIDRFMIGRERIATMLRSNGLDYLVHSFYLVGEDEENYYAPLTGLQNSIERRLEDYDLLMLSSNALWLLAATKLFLKKKINWVALLEELKENNKRCLLTMDNDCIRIVQNNLV